MDDIRGLARCRLGLLCLTLAALIPAARSAVADDTRPALLPPFETLHIDRPAADAKALREKAARDADDKTGENTMQGDDKKSNNKKGDDKEADDKEGDDKKGEDKPDAKDKQPEPPLETPPGGGHVVDLATCRQIALVRQPTLAAARASLATAQTRAAGLQRLPQIPIVARELPVRRQQACLGVAIAAAGLEQAQWDTLYDVTRCYLAAVYARQQLDLADQAIRELRELRKLTAEFDDKEEEAEQLSLYIEVVAGRREAALQGVSRAHAALREALGLEPGVAVQVLDRRLPLVSVALTREQVVQLALARRGELVQAGLAAQVTCREVEAQALRSLHPSVRTFAAGSDIHATPVPTADRGTDYRPGALAPEMPPFLVGDRDARVSQARSLTARANSLAEKVRGLITLEAEDAFLRYQEAERKLPRLREAAGIARRRADRLAEDAKNPDVKPRFNDATAAGTLAGQLRVEVNEAQLQLLLALAALERVTAGGVSAGLEYAHADAGEPATPAQPGDKDKGDRDKGDKPDDGEKPDKDDKDKSDQPEKSREPGQDRATTGPSK